MPPLSGEDAVCTTGKSKLALALQQMRDESHFLVQIQSKDGGQV
jgi:chloramphenicol 3-O-phosphotransferase